MGLPVDAATLHSTSDTNVIGFSLLRSALIRGRCPARHRLCSRGYLGCLAPGASATLCPWLARGRRALARAGSRPGPACHQVPTAGPPLALAVFVQGRAGQGRGAGRPWPAHCASRSGQLLPCMCAFACQVKIVENSGAHSPGPNPRGGAPSHPPQRWRRGADCCRAERGPPGASCRGREE